LQKNGDRAGGEEHIVDTGGNKLNSAATSAVVFALAMALCKMEFESSYFSLTSGEIGPITRESLEPSHTASSELPESSRVSFLMCTCLVSILKRREQKPLLSSCGCLFDNAQHHTGLSDTGVPSAGGCTLKYLMPLPHRHLFHVPYNTCTGKSHLQILFEKIIDHHNPAFGVL